MTGVLVYVIGWWFKNAINVINDMNRVLVYVIGWFKSAINDKIWMRY